MFATTLSKRLLLLLVGSILISIAQAATAQDRDMVAKSSTGTNDGIIYGVLVNRYFDHSTGDAIDRAKAQKILYSIYSAEGEPTLMNRVVSGERIVVGDNAQPRMLFVKRQPAGTFYLSKISFASGAQTFTGFPNLQYEVAAGKATYIGSLQIDFFGARGLFGDVLSRRVRVSVIDEFDEVTKTYKESNPGDPFETQKDMARSGR